MRVKSLSAFFVFFLTIAPASLALAFDTYVHTNYQNQPDLSQYGIKYLRFTGAFWKKGDDHQLLPSKDRVISIVSKSRGNHTGLMAIDWEGLPLGSGSDAQVASKMEKRITVLEWVKQAAPNATVGYYGVVPVGGGYWATSPADYEKWRENNDRVQELTDRLPVLFPNFYAERSDQDRWKKYATDLLNESKRIGKGKRVYLVINLRYHPQACCGLGQKLIPREFFAFQLKTMKDLGYNGVVIWQQASHKSQWSEDLPWWQATKEFLGAN